MQTRCFLRQTLLLLLLLLLLLDSSCLSLCLHSLQLLLQVALLRDQVSMLLLLVHSTVCTALYTRELLKQSIMLRGQLLVLCLLLLLESSVLVCFRVQLHLQILNLMLHSSAVSGQLLHMSLLGMLCLSVQTTDAAWESVQHPLHVCAVLFQIKRPLLVGLQHLLKLTLLQQMLLKLLLQLLVMLLCMLGVSWHGRC